MKSIMMESYNDKTIIFGKILYEDGLPAKYVNVMLECICPIVFTNKKLRKCKWCSLSRLTTLALTTTDKNGNFIFIIRNKKLIYYIRVINELIQ